ncbi:MAG: phenylalanine 4-monooxygenase [Deltaproteobacteria bacterium]|nr:MAG: phenylalanine 4-monooxygenase [Deltaproteobacteria bacterium]
MDTPSLVVLDRDHPGFRDPVYRARRDAIARLALAHRDGDPPPRVEYAEEEHSVWSVVWTNLAPIHDRYACSAWFDGDRRLRLSRTRVPQFIEVNAQLQPMTGFCLMPVAGLVTPGAFLRELGRGVFLSTQYMRHASAPLYTPEPDVVHELIGHAASLANADFALLNRRFGEVAMTLSDDAMQPLIRAYWYSLEFGVIRDAGALKVYGAGLLSSFGECGRFETSAELVPFDLDVMAETPFDPTDYQRRLFVAPSFEAMKHGVLAWLAKRAR